MNSIVTRRVFVATATMTMLTGAGLVYADLVQTGDLADFCYDVDIENGETIRDVYGSAEVVANLRLLGLEPVTAPEHGTGGATPNENGDDTEAIQDAIFAAMEDCVNARGIDAYGELYPEASPQGKGSGADPNYYTDGCRAVFFPPGDYRVSDTIRVMQPLKPESGRLQLSLNNDGEVLYDTSDMNAPTTTPTLGDYLDATGGQNPIGKSMRRKSNVLIGSTCQWPNNNKTRPVVTARPGYFSEDKPIFQFWAQCRNGGMPCDPAGDENADIDIGVTDPAYGQSSVMFNNVFRNIDIDSNVGVTREENGVTLRNTGAIGISFPGAQGSAIEDTTITLTDGQGNHSYMGIRNIPGQSGGIFNVTVDGGEFGIWMDRETRFGMAVGLRLYDQTNRGILHKANNKMVVVGFHITRNTNGPAVRINSDNPTTGSPEYGSWNGIAMVDGVLENEGNAVLDVVQRPAYLRNVLMHGTGTNMVTTGTTTNLTKQTSDPWQLVTEWAWVSNNAASGPPQSMKNGTVDDNATAGIEEQDLVMGVTSQTVPDIPADNAEIESRYIADHLWGVYDLPHFEDGTSTVILANTHDQNTVTLTTNYLTTHGRVFLGGGGRHPISSTVVIKDGKALAGLDRVHTVIETRSSTNRSALQWDNGCANDSMIRAQNDVDSDAGFGRVSLAEWNDCTKFIPFDWKAGANSFSHGVVLTRSDKSGSPGYPSEVNQAGFRFSLNAGGRHWGLQPDGALIEYLTNDSTYRHLDITGTDESLTIYGFNCEKVSGGTYACEVDGASNVTFYNVKAETCKQCDPGLSSPFRNTANSILRFNDVQNVELIGYGGNAQPGLDGGSGLPVIRIDNSATSNLLLVLINPNTSDVVPEKGSGNWFTVKRFFGNNGAINGARIGAYVIE